MNLNGMLVINKRRISFKSFIKKEVTVLSEINQARTHNFYISSFKSDI